MTRRDVWEEIVTEARSGRVPLEHKVMREKTSLGGPAIQESYSLDIDGDEVGFTFDRATTEKLVKALQSLLAAEAR